MTVTYTDVPAYRIRRGRVVQTAAYRRIMRDIARAMKAGGAVDVSFASGRDKGEEGDVIHYISAAIGDAPAKAGDAPCA